MKSLKKMSLNVNNIRKDFPILQKKLAGKPIVYFDNACQSLRPKQVIEKINEYYTDFPACGERSMHKLGKKVDEAVDKARKSLQNFFNAKNRLVLNDEMIIIQCKKDRRDYFHKKRHRGN